MRFTKINPIVLLLFNLVVPLSMMVPGRPVFHPFFLGMAAVVLLISGKVKRLLKFAAAYAVIFGLTWLFRIWANVLGQVLATLIIASMQFFPCMMAASILILDYSSADLISALSPFRIPKGFTVALSVVIRYIPTFRREFAAIKESMRIRRVPYSFWHPIRSFEFFLVPQLFRCSILADEITSAGLTKGITNPALRTCYRDIRMHTADWCVSGIFLLGTAVILLWR